MDEVRVALDGLFDDVLNDFVEFEVVENGLCFCVEKTDEGF